MKMTTLAALLRSTSLGLRDILGRLDAARSVSDMDLPGLRLHPLKGTLRGLWAVTVRANWRVTFRFSGPDAFDVDYVDYHQRGMKKCR
jgi:proteic killer suppression protein